jgi:hypothetical protein
LTNDHPPGFLATSPSPHGERRCPMLTTRLLMLALVAAALALFLAEGPIGPF